MNKPKVCKALEFPQQRYKSVFLQNNICVTTENNDWDIYIPNYGPSMTEEMKSLTNTEGKYIMGIPGCSTFTRRKDVWVNIVKSYGREMARKIMPETFILNFAPDVDLLQKTYPQTPFILKSRHHKRKGLKIIESPTNIIDLLEEYEVAQPLQNNLYQINNTSFNLRSYLLITIQKGILKTYIYYDANCIYAISSLQDVELEKKIITNSLNSIPKGFPLLMTDFCVREKIDYGDFFLNLGNNVNLLMTSALPNLGKMENLSGSYCFQIFGLDVLIDKNGIPIICEINKGPGMDAKNESADRLKNQMLNDALSVVGLRKAKNIGFVKTMESKLANN